jgi:acyl carrier protein
MHLFQWIQAGFYFLTVIGIWLSWKTFSANQRIRRAEWLRSLFEKFYESQNYKEVRRWLDFEDLLQKELGNDITHIRNDEEHLKEEKLADYLNFFEFIAALEKLKQLSLTEIKLLFAYYLEKIKQTAVCVDYIQAGNYRNLSNLLERI